MSRVVSLFYNSSGDQHHHRQADQSHKHLKRHTTLLSPLTRGFRPSECELLAATKDSNPMSYLACQNNTRPKCDSWPDDRANRGRTPQQEGQQSGPVDSGWLFASGRSSRHLPGFPQPTGWNLVQEGLNGSYLICPTSYLMILKKVEPRDDR